MKELRYIHPLSAAKVTALLGVLWALLGWLFSGLIVLLLGSEALPPEVSAFSLGGLISGIIGGVIGGGLSGYLGSLVYNLIAGKIGGVVIDIHDSAEEAHRAPAPSAQPMPQSPSAAPTNPSTQQ